MKTPTCLLAMAMTACGGGVEPLAPEVTARVAVVGWLSAPEFAATATASGGLVVAARRGRALVVSRCEVGCQQASSWREVELLVDAREVSSLAVSSSPDGGVTIAWLQARGAEAEVVLARCTGPCASADAWALRRIPAPNARTVAVVARPHDVAWLVAHDAGVTLVDCTASWACRSTTVSGLPATTLQLSRSGAAVSAVVVADGALHGLHCDDGCDASTSWVETRLWPVASAVFAWAQRGEVQHVAFIGASARASYGTCRAECGNPLSWVATKVSGDEARAVALSLDVNGAPRVWQRTARAASWWRCGGHDCADVSMTMTQVPRVERTYALSVDGRAQSVLLVATPVLSEGWALEYEVAPDAVKQ